MNDAANIERLVKKAIRGNVDAYGELIEMHKDYLYRTAYMAVKNQENALDIVSECMLNGFVSIGKLRQPAYFKTWLTRILYNTIHDFYKKNPVSEPLEVYQVQEPEQSVSKEERMDLYQAINNLSERYRDIVVLKYFNELKISEIAYVLDLPEGSVKAYLSRARTELKQLLEEPAG